MIICICARTCGTFGLIGLLKLCGYEKDNVNKITFKDYVDRRQTEALRPDRYQNIAHAEEKLLSRILPRIEQNITEQGAPSYVRASEQI